MFVSPPWDLLGTARAQIGAALTIDGNDPELGALLADATAQHQYYSKPFVAGTEPGSPWLPQVRVLAGSRGMVGAAARWGHPPPYAPCPPLAPGTLATF